MISDHLPCMIFSEDGILCDERGVLASLCGITTKNVLSGRFLRSLYGDRDDFLAFCRNGQTDEYRIYRLRSLTPDDRFRFAFCEKNELFGQILTSVFLAHNAECFYELMSPSSGLIRNTGDSTVYGILKAKSSAVTGSSRLSAEAFSVAERIPRLLESIYEPRASARYCDVIKLTGHITSAVSSSPVFSSEIRFSAGNQASQAEQDDPAGAIIEVPIEAYTAVLSVILGILSSLSANHIIEIRISFYSGSADVEVRTSCDRITKDCRLAGLGFLVSYGARNSLIRLAETVSYVSGIELSVDFDSETGSLCTTLGIGYEMQSIPDFKYSDPFEFVDEILSETASLSELL